MLVTVVLGKTDQNISITKWSLLGSAVVDMNYFRVMAGTANPPASGFYPENPIIARAEGEKEKKEEEESFVEYLLSVKHCSKNIPQII